MPLFLPYSPETLSCLRDIARPFSVSERGGAPVFTPGLSSSAAVIPACRPADLGDPGFCRAHNLKYAYVGGSMANGTAHAARGSAGPADARFMAPPAST